MDIMEVFKMKLHYSGRKFCPINIGKILMILTQGTFFVRYSANLLKTSKKGNYQTLTINKFLCPQNYFWDYYTNGSFCLFK